MAQTLGIVDLVWRGRKLATEKGAKLMLGGIKQNPVIAGRQVHYAGEMEASTVNATILLERGLRMTELWTVGYGELQVLCDTGQSYVFPDAFLTNRPNATGGEGGKVEMEWAAGFAEEILNG